MQKEGQKVFSKHFLVLIAQGSGKVGLTVSKKVGNAVKRNYIKRCLRDILRSVIIPSDKDMVIVARSSSAEITYIQMKNDLQEVIHG